MGTRNPVYPEVYIHLTEFRNSQKNVEVDRDVGLYFVCAIDAFPSREFPMPGGIMASERPAGFPKHFECAGGEDAKQDGVEAELEPKAA